MSESIKAICWLVIIICEFVAVFVWSDDRPDATVWKLRLGCIIVAVLALVPIFKLNTRRDHVHDYLGDLSGSFFNRKGFTFSFEAMAIDGTAYMYAYFQNQYDQPCVGQIALRPVNKLFRGRAKIETIRYKIDCAPAGFGFARIAIPIPQDLQGKPLQFEVGAAAEFPDGKGQRLRFDDGVFLRTGTDFVNSIGTANAIVSSLNIFGLLMGSMNSTNPAFAIISLPKGVAEHVPDQRVPEVQTLWQLDDEPIEGGIRRLLNQGLPSQRC